MSCLDFLDGVFSSTDRFIVGKIHLSLFLYFESDSNPGISEIHEATPVHIVKAMVFLVVTYGCESWTLKQAEHQRIDAFRLWC